MAAEVIGVVSGVIAIVEVISKSYGKIKQIRGLHPVRIQILRLFKPQAQQRGHVTEMLILDPAGFRDY